MESYRSADESKEDTRTLTVEFLTFDTFVHVSSLGRLVSSLEIS